MCVCFMNGIFVMTSYYCFPFAMLYGFLLKMTKYVINLRSHSISFFSPLVVCHPPFIVPLCIVMRYTNSSFNTLSPTQKHIQLYTELNFASVSHTVFHLFRFCVEREREKMKRERKRKGEKENERRMCAVRCKYEPNGV